VGQRLGLELPLAVQTWQLPQESDTRALAAEFAARLPRGGDCFRIELVGELGAGKTTFARGLLTALGATAPIKSPTYTLLELHAVPSWVVVHLDFYRLNDPQELENLGLSDYDRAGHLWLMEWPQRASGQLPPADLVLQFDIAADHHRLTAGAYSKSGQRVLIP
jgi:tRNA threonylcarbamoyladenosine biosynthesis protein TsaE